MSQFLFKIYKDYMTHTNFETPQQYNKPNLTPLARQGWGPRSTSMPSRSPSPNCLLSTSAIRYALAACSLSTQCPRLHASLQGFVSQETGAGWRTKRLVAVTQANG